jgi:hypothetical protein
MACVCCDLFICEKVKDLFDKFFIEVGESDWVVYVSLCI